MKRLCLFLSLVVFISFGCKQRVVTQPESEQPPQQKEQQQAREEAVESKTAPEKITEREMPSMETIESRDKAIARAEQEGLFKDVLFDFDSYNVQEQYKPALKSLASWMMKHKDVDLSIEGHCDERGTNEYNLALGDRRARAVKDYLISLGVPSSRTQTMSYGEERPLCQEHTEACWAKNRRAHFVILGGNK
jgi:peptidoglycan-associated lipoprotein